MDINASIVDQRVRGLAEKWGDQLKGDEDARRSKAFVLLCVMIVLDLPEDEALERLTDGGQDADIDAIEVGDVRDGEFVVTLFQGKYKRDLDGRSAYPGNSIKKIVGTVSTIFDPDKKLLLRDELEAKVEEVRSLIRDGNIPTVRVVLCNNGLLWGADGQSHIDSSGLKSQVSWEHVNHDRIVEMMQRQKSVNDVLQLHGKALVEEFHFRRVLVGKVPVTEIAALFNRHDDRLLERNIRRYLGLSENRVNQAIQQTLLDVNKRQNFYFYNNGITAICSKFRHNGLQAENFQVQVEDLQIINGGQTCKTIQKTLSEHPNEDYNKTYALLRLYELDATQGELVGDITYATNSQNPVDLRDLRANDGIQRKLEAALPPLGYEYKRKRDGSSPGPMTITSSVAAEAVFAVWRRKPHQAKFRRGELFTEYFYSQIFRDDLNAAQVILAVLIFRMVENERKRPTRTSPPRALPYASHFLAMLAGEGLLQRNNLKSIAGIDHRNFAAIKADFEANAGTLYDQAVAALEKALTGLGITPHTSLQRLAATFRRGDLLEELNKG